MRNKVPARIPSELRTASGPVICTRHASARFCVPCRVCGTRAAVTAALIKAGGVKDISASAVQDRDGYTDTDVDMRYCRVRFTDC